MQGDAPHVLRQVAPHAASVEIGGADLGGDFGGIAGAGQGIQFLDLDNIEGEASAGAAGNAVVTHLAGDPEPEDFESPVTTDDEEEEVEEGLERTVDWYLANSDWWQPLLERKGVGERLGTKA